MNCPECHGAKSIVGVFPIYANSVPMEKRKPTIILPCSFCGGTGEVDEYYPIRQRIGERCRRERMRHDMSLREFVRRVGLDSVLVSRFERGVAIADGVAETIGRAYWRMFGN